MANSDFEFDFYLDESGLFLDAKTEMKQQGFASQLAGILAPRGKFDAKKAKEIIKLIRSKAQLPLDGELHGKDLRSGTNYDALVTELANQLHKRGVQPVRIVNDCHIDFGSRIANYTNMFAELVVRICKRLYSETQNRVVLHVVADQVRLVGKEGSGYMSSAEYKQRLKEFIARAALQNGFTEVSRWEVRLDLQYANRIPQLQLADVVSNSSHGDFRKLGVETKQIARAAFGPFDFTLNTAQILESIDEHLAKDLLGPALRLIAERICQEDRGGTLKKKLMNRLETVLERLCELGTSGRNAQLNQLIPWLEHLINEKRDLDFANRLLHFLTTKVSSKLEEQLAAQAESISWFTFVLHRWSLSCYNHQGDLVKARIQAERMDYLSATLAQQWEHAPLLLSGLIVQAVHHTDSFEHDRACQSMELVCGYYEQLSGLFNAAMPSTFPEKIRSHQHAKALGSWMQAETKASIRDPARFNHARHLSDLAMQEFATGSDLRRQQQYRCELETYAGKPEHAKFYLARSLELPPGKDGFKDIITCIQTKELSHQGFPLLHLSRIAAVAVKSGDEDTWRDFERMADSSGLWGSPWCRGEGNEGYPQHGVLRHILVLRAAKGQWEHVDHLLRCLRELCKNSPLFMAIELAARAEVAVVAWEKNNRFVKNLLRDRDQGLCKRLESLLKQTANYPESFVEPFQSCRNYLLGTPASADLEKKALLNFALAIAY